MSFLKKLFGGGGGEKPAEKAPSQEHNGYVIEATPVAEGGQFRVCGVIWKEVDGARKEHVFHRADRFASRDEAVDMTFQKGRQIINERRDRVFD